MMPELDRSDLQPSFPNPNTGSPHFPPIPSFRPIKPNADFISAAEREVLDEAKARLVLPSKPRPSPYERSILMMDALERKKAAVLLLVSAQRDVETHSSFMIEEEGLEETIRFYDALYDIGDHYTATGRFINAVSSINFKTHSSVNDQTLVCAT